jgi:hypothetical protein
MPRPARLLLVLLPTLAVVGAVGWLVARSWDGTPRPSPGDGPAAEGGRLVVVAVFDQMRGDYVDRWAAEFGPDGFERMKREGVWYSDARLPYACSATGPGHASIGTGAPPAVHGIIENEWYDRGRGKFVDAWTADDGRYSRVPPAAGPEKQWDPIAPAKLLAPTVGDALRASTGGDGRCFSISLKARSAVLMGGKGPTAAYCFDDRAGGFHTSTYYRERLHPWAEAFNKSDADAKWAGTAWDRLKPAAVYDRLAGPDDQAGESPTGIPPTTTFPHRLPAVADGYYKAVERTPFGNELVWAFAKACIDGENLGKKGVPDLLYLGFSSNDIVGHAHGPDSHEVMDVTLRSDRLVADMIAFLDGHLGRDRYTLIVTADHGSTPLPEVSAKGHPTARRIGPGDLIGGLEEALDDVFGRPDGAGRWVEADFARTFPWVYLDRRTVALSGVPADEVAGYVRTWLANRPDAEAAFTRGDLEVGAGGEVGRAVKLAFHPDRCGEVYVLPKPYVLVLSGYSTGTSHGSPHPYDRHVPVLAIGAGVPPLGRRTEPVSSLVVAPLAAARLGVPPPAGAKEPLPAELR